MSAQANRRRIATTHLCAEHELNRTERNRVSMISQTPKLTRANWQGQFAVVDQFELRPKRTCMGGLYMSASSKLKLEL